MPHRVIHLQRFSLPLVIPTLFEPRFCVQVFNCASDRYITYNGLFREVGKVRICAENTASSLRLSFVFVCPHIFGSIPVVCA